MSALVLMSHDTPLRLKEVAMTYIDKLDLSWMPIHYRTIDTPHQVYSLINSHPVWGGSHDLHYVITFGQAMLDIALGPDDNRNVGPLLGKPTFTDAFPGLQIIAFPCLKFLAGQPKYSDNMLGYANEARRRLWETL